MKSTLTIASLYAGFAVIATIVNIASQYISIRLYTGPYSLYFSIIVGTGTGLIIKYLLDKKYIFNYTTQNAAQDTQLFTLYALMGIITTAIFWGMEFAFNHWFNGDEFWRYVGGVIGLAIGYCSKYWLDKRFVFNK